MATDAHTGPVDGSADEPLHVANANHLDSIVDEHDVVLVDFFATWCGPCQLLEPVLEQLANETDATIAKVDVDANPALAGSYGVRGVPTLALFADGEQVEQHTGALPAHQLSALIEGYTD
ncbi:thioredoxin [Natronobiforma cellulositropha]|uniref:thioredoxin n=1 Tax=Natronobiforma cellulositropha TaxID=1679076 RepID=UPI0021D595BC|nr:thioredoxin [Natronobiforma cellulositropha]